MNTEKRDFRSEPAASYCVLRDFLDAGTHEQLIEWTIRNEDNSEPTVIGGKTRDDGGTHDPTWRRSVGVRNFGSVQALLRERILSSVPELIGKLRVMPFTPSDVEIELVASNDGAFYKPHLDTFLGRERREADRLVSAIYYFHSEPKAFAGGALRLHPFAVPGTQKRHIDIEPEQNTLVAFPSWELHEVLPVSCPSRRFSASRFSVNLWILR